MGRLVDEDDVKNWLQERIDGYESLHLGGNSRSAELKIIINELPARVPAVYDPDKVVEQLDDYLFEKYCVEGDSEIEKIVKGGGVDGN